MLVQLGQEVLVLKGNLADAVSGYGHQLSGEVHGGVGGEEGTVLQYAEGGAEVEPEVIGRQTLRRLPGNHVEDTLEAFCQGGEIDGFSVGRPYGGVGIIFKGVGEVPDARDGGIGALAVAVFGIYHVGHHQAHFVGLVAVPFHGQPQEMAAVRTPDGMGVVTAREGDLGSLTGEGAVDVDAGVGRESVLLASELFAGIGHETAVGAPGKVGDVGEGAVGQLEELAVQDVHPFLDYAVNQGGQESMADFRTPVVPVAVHEVFRGIGFGLVQQRVGVGGNLYGAVYGRNIEDLALVRGKEIVVDALFYVRKLCALAQPAVFVGRLVQLAALQEEDGVAVVAPAGAGNAFPVHGELRGFSSFHGNGEEVAHAAVLGDVRVAYAIEDGFSVRRQLRVGEPSQGQEEFRSHVPVGDFQAGGADVTFLRFHFVAGAGDEAQGEGHRRKEFSVHIIELHCSGLAVRPGALPGVPGPPGGRRVCTVP